MSIEATFEDGTLVMSKVYQARRETVFDAWIETSKTQIWWGCANTIKVVSEIEPRVGGKYRHVMTIKDVGDHPINGTLTEYDPPALLVYSVTDPGNVEAFSVRVEFVEKGDATEVRLTQRPIPTEYKDVITAGWTASFGKLEALVAPVAA